MVLEMRMGTGMQGNSFLIVFFSPKSMLNAGGVAATVKIKTLAHAAKFEMENKICQQDNHPHMQDLPVFFPIFFSFCLLPGKTLDTLLYLVSQPTVYTPRSTLAPPFGQPLATAAALLSCY